MHLFDKAIEHTDFISASKKLAADCPTDEAGATRD